MALNPSLKSASPKPSMLSGGNEDGSDGTAQPPPVELTEFEQTTRKIGQHNVVIEDLKRRIQAIQCRMPVTCVEQQELQCLRSCLRQEMKTLNTIIQMAIEKQSENPDQPFGMLPIPTTIEEDQLPHLMFYPPDTFKTAPQPKKKKPAMGESASIYVSAKSVIFPSENEGNTTEVENGEQQKAMEDEVDHEQLQADIRYRDMMIECLQQKMRCLKDEMTKICDASQRQTCLPCPSKKSNSPYARVQKKICCPAAAVTQLQENALHAGCMQEQLDQMATVLNQLQTELSSVQKERVELNKIRKESQVENENRASISTSCGGAPCGPCRPCDPSVVCTSPDAEELVNQHNTLLCEYAKKDREVKYLRHKVEQLDAAKTGKSGDSVEKVQIGILTERIKELKDEEEEFKMLIAEQQQQISEYRCKFLHAQQTVVEQRAVIDGLDVNKAHIEEQINVEVNRIKTRFQEKLKELAPLPKLLQSEQFKLQTLKEENADMVTQMGNLTAQLRKARKDLKKLQSNSGGGDSKRANAEMNSLRKLLEEAEQDKRDMCEQLKQSQKELDCIQKETNRLMMRTKERTECTKEALQARIDRLEIELAETRAKSSLKLADRDGVIQNMQEQLNDLSGSFGDAQKQIRCLKKRMTDLSVSEDKSKKCVC